MFVRLWDPCNSSKILVIVCLLLLALTCGANPVGVCYGVQADNLPSPQKTVQLIQAQTITKVRLFNYDPGILQAFSNTQIEVVIAIPNEQISDFANSKGDAMNWVKNNVAAALPGTNIVGITVGSEVLTSATTDIASCLVPAMKNIYAGLVNSGIEKQVKISSPNSMGVLSTSFPPSAGTFDSNLQSVMLPFLEFLSKTGSYFMVNAYPYYAYRNQMQYTSISYALFQPNPGYIDENSGLKYLNLLDAQLDAVFYALAGYHHGELNIVVSETGWPSMGDPQEVKIVNMRNAAAYNGNLVKRISSGTGTPYKPEAAITAYIFELFNEDQRPGPTSNRNWGLLQPDGSKVYGVDLGGGLGSGNGDGGGGGGGGGGVIQVNRSFCIANPTASFGTLQSRLDWACGTGDVDCSAIQPGHSCYQPDTVTSHASYAFNSYFQNNGMDPSVCTFSGAAIITTQDPSYASCIYKGSSRFPTSNALKHYYSWALVVSAFICSIILLNNGP